jgi:hypothetical protein
LDDGLDAGVAESICDVCGVGLDVYCQCGVCGPTEAYTNFSDWFEGNVRNFARLYSMNDLPKLKLTLWQLLATSENVR